ncbi:MAG: sigma 54-interacting transcriptional regulator [Planctomycetota bacterium]
MKAADLRLESLLHFHPEGGILRFAGQRAAILDVAALGLLRQELIETLGEPAARGVLTRFGFAHGWRVADSLEGAFDWDDPGEWRRAGGRLHTLQGLVLVEGVPGQGEGQNAFAEALWHDSYEAEQHLVQRGRSEQPVCWSLTGFASGYLSRSNDAEIYCLETQCVARGDPVCRFQGRRRAEWGPELEPHLAFYERDCLEQTLKTTRDTLRRLQRKLRRAQRQLPPEARESLDPSGLVARSAALRAVLDLARRAARVDSTVLITGESGVGKERIARYLHEASARAAGPFVAINCGAISENLIESELFGHARGAFTGASQGRVGLFEAAQGGTLLLDEVGELPPGTQVKLLRVLQEREVRRVGENQPRRIDVRVVAATLRDLQAEVRAGRFREDLLYRLKVLELEVPPLRARPDDVLPLARVLVQRIAARLGCPARDLSAAAADRLVGYPWPGNVRELENALERAVVVAGGERIEVQDLPPEVRAAAPAPAPAALPAAASGERALADVVREHVLASLERHGGNRAETAAALGIGVATLYRHLRRYRDEGRAP